MPKNDPSYVKVAERINDSIVLDVESAWSISGLDVKEFPKDDARAANFVRGRLRAGALEEASKAEFEEVQSLNKKSEQNPPLESGLQEGRLQTEAAEARTKLTAKRTAASKKKEDEEEE